MSYVITKLPDNPIVVAKIDLHIDHQIDKATGHCYTCRGCVICNNIKCSYDVIRHCFKCGECHHWQFDYCNFCNKCYHKKNKLKHCDECKTCVLKRYGHCKICKKCHSIGKVDCRP